MARHTNEGGWGSLIGGLAQIALAGGVAYIAHQTREAYLEPLLAAPTSEAIQSLLETVPSMDDTVWALFVNGLERHAKTSNHAQDLLSFAIVARNIVQTVDYILSKSTIQAKVMLIQILPDMDDATWNICRHILTLKSTENPSARTLLNYAEHHRHQEGSAEDLFRESIYAALADGVITSNEGADLEALRSKLNMPTETAHRILLEVKAGKTRTRGEINKPRTVTKVPMPLAPLPLAPSTSSAIGAINKPKAVTEASQKTTRTAEFIAKAETLFSEGKYEEALNYVEEAIDSDAQSAEAWIHYGNVLTRLQRYSKAIQSFERARQLRPKDATARYNAACVYALQRKVEPALDYLADAIKLNRNCIIDAEKDPDFQNIRSHPQFVKLLQS